MQTSARVRERAFDRGFDITRRYVRFREHREDGFVEFDFSIGDPRLSVELVMPLREYRSFCHANRVIHLTRDEGEQLDFEESKWRYGQPGLSE
ncbi:phenol hydroxylase subunit [Caballeronia cordobensis]|uniref:Phenol hydroxylase subunit n=1 Tax=Caballeronia cordobensis TaxID=1353886 RepID=A0A158IUH2_CABCO|nr:phenol hydroxylase subunit [Caballeronia cordobensis]SAL59799.1 phenol hydroxylase subunit [Caballeronia cordobensis]